MANVQTAKKPVATDRVRELMGAIEAGAMEFGPIDAIDLHALLQELLTLRNNGGVR